MKARIQEGDYSPDEIARMLLWASGSYREAKKALTRADNELKSVAPKLFQIDHRGTASAKRGNDTAMYLAAYHLFQKKSKKKCSDITALRKLLGNRYRPYYDRLKVQKLTLKQIAQLVQGAPENA